MKAYKQIVMNLMISLILFQFATSTRNESITGQRFKRDSSRHFMKVARENGYISEEFTTVTEDGYVLTLFRLVSGNCQKNSTTPVLLMHGLLMTANSWIDSGPKAGLAYLLADACHDVWIGNIRGNYYSRNHIQYNPDKDSEYWNYDIDEVGRFDLPASIDHILNTTGTEKLKYIGFSVGAGAFFVMCSERPAYCDKVKILIALAPGGRMTNTKSGIFINSLNIINGLPRTEEIEMLAKGSFVQTIASSFCRVPTNTDICSLVLQQLDHVTFNQYGSISNDTLRVLFDHMPSGTSSKIVTWHSQRVKSDVYTKYDYGKVKNMVVYGTEEPPKYNLSAVTVPVFCMYGKNDALVDVKDVQWLMSQLPNVVEFTQVRDPLWSHFDVAYSQHTKAMIFNKINEYLLRYQ